MAHAQAEAACQTNGGKLAHIPSDLIAVFFKAVKKDDAMYDIYWVAPEPAPAKNGKPRLRFRKIEPTVIPTVTISTLPPYFGHQQ